MIDFNSLELVAVKKVEKHEHILHGKRYVLGSDPFIQNGSSHSVFYVYDKIAMSTILKLKSHKTFDQFVEWVTKKQEVDNKGLSKRECIVSRKFITDAGTAVRVAHNSTH